jgi:protein-arginine deiminase
VNQTSQPVLLCSSLDPVTELFVVESPLTERFVAELKRLASVPVHAIPNDPEHAADIWMQDTVEFCVRGESVVALLGLRGEHDQGLTCGPLDLRVKAYLSQHFPAIKQQSLGTPLAKRRWIDWFGNLEVSPPVPNFPNGRLLTGRQKGLAIHPGVLDFFAEQKAQWPPVFIDVSWLTIGHVDEVINFVPAPKNSWRCLLPSVRLAKKILESQPKDAVVFAGKKEQTTVKALLDVANNAENQAIELALATTKTQINAELGIDARKILELPALFRDGLPIIPNPVNCLVVNNTIFLPDPCFAPLAEAMQKPLEALGLTVHLIDIWEPYHTRSGEIHCGTNAIRRKQHQR